MKNGNCEITGSFLQAHNVHCHHYIPLQLGGSDKFNNLRILHKDVHKIIHMTDAVKMNTLMKIWASHNRCYRKLINIGKNVN